MEDKTWDRVTGLALGALVGFFAGILLAPTAGQETRTTIKNKAQGSVDQVKSTAVNLQQKIRDQGRSLLTRETLLNSTAKSPSADEPETAGS